MSCKLERKCLREHVSDICTTSTQYARSAQDIFCPERKRNKMRFHVLRQRESNANISVDTETSRRETENHSTMDSYHEMTKPHCNTTSENGNPCIMKSENCVGNPEIDLKTVANEESVNDYHLLEIGHEESKNHVNDSSNGIGDKIHNGFIIYNGTQLKTCFNLCEHRTFILVVDLLLSFGMMLYLQAAIEIINDIQSADEESEFDITYFYDGVLYKWFDNVD